MAETEHHREEFLNVLTKSGEKTGVAKPRGLVHQDGDYHRAVHVWIYAESTGELFLQKRSDCKDSWPGQWDISSAAIFLLEIPPSYPQEEELGIKLPNDAFEILFVYLQECVINNGSFINNEYNDVYFVTTLAPIPLYAFTLQESEVSAVKYMSCAEYKTCLAEGDEQYVPYEIDGSYGQLFTIIENRYKENIESRSLSLQKQIQRYNVNYWMFLLILPLFSQLQTVCWKVFLRVMKEVVNK
ncbi:hypothetical protein LUZ60_000799 [Juncus effusus]|nr:hypothetical protein LUZ60_000799 [Juncus effusus]